MAGRTGIVTGGTRGIGRAVVEKLAADGLDVFALGRDEEALEEVAALGESVRGRRCDVSSEREVAAVFEEVGPVDVLVNNAGISDSAPLARTSLGEWRAQLEVNATGAFLCTRAALPGMLERDSGRIVTVASTAALVGYRYTAAYTASKHAALGLMRATAAEVAGTGATANAVCPAFVRTEMTELSVQRIAATTGRSDEESVRALERSSPLGRLLEPQEVAEAVSFLASERGGAINGQAIVLDGGGIQR